MPVPASYNDIPVDAAVRDHVGDAWYQTTVRVPRGWAGQRVVLRFDAATHRAVVWVDDVEVARHEGGYTPFEADVTEHVAAGRGGADHGRRRQPPDLARRCRRASSRTAAGAADLLPRLLQLRRAAPLGLAVQHPAGATSGTSRWSPASTAARARSTTGWQADGDVRAGSCSTPRASRSPGPSGADGRPHRRRRAPVAAGRGVPLRPAGRARRRRRRRRQLHAARWASARSRCAGTAVPDQRRTVPLHRVRQARGRRRPRQGPRRRAHAPRLRAAGVDRRQLVPDVALPLRRGGAGLRRPARHRRHRRDGGGGPEPRHDGRDPAPRVPADLLAGARSTTPAARCTRRRSASSSPGTRTTPASCCGASPTSRSPTPTRRSTTSSRCSQLTRELDPTRPVGTSTWSSRRTAGDRLRRSATW